MYEELVELLRMRAALIDSDLDNQAAEAIINGMSWEKVAVKMNYSYRHTTRLHGIALQKLKIE